jgi:single-strand DNA-binding protein
VINKVILIGRLGADPEIRYTPSGAEVATFRIATSEAWTNKSGEKEERTEWHRIVAWRGLAKVCGEFLNKGKLVYIEGRLRTRSWEDRDGNKRTTTEIEATDMKMLGGVGHYAGLIDFGERVLALNPVMYPAGGISGHVFHRPHHPSQKVHGVNCLVDQGSATVEGERASP